MTTSLYIGAMTGTSMDGIDAVLLEVSNNNSRTCADTNLPIPSQLRSTLSSLTQPGENEIQRSGEASIQLGILIAEAVNKLLDKTGLAAEEIKAIGSHGQTIRHSVEGAHPFTLQIGDPSTIAQRTGITTIADFRMADIAAGGQGAPLAPAFHHAVFSSNDENRAIINLGGIANISRLTSHEKVLGFDTGPANTLMDQWIQLHKDQPYDNDGQWAKSGGVISTMLASMVEDPYLKRKAPKSTGREYFNLEWLGNHIKDEHCDPADVQRTLLEFTAISVSGSVKQMADIDSVYLCGGGVYNQFLVERLKSLLPGYAIYDTSELGIDPQHVEAAAFAWLAHRTIHRLSGNLPSVTGARSDKILGAIYQSS